VKSSSVVLTTNPLDMKLSFNPFPYVVMIVSATLLTSCYTEDPGPIQEYDKDFTVTDFDKLQMGDAFNITVEQGDLFQIKATGDRRNIDDLIVDKDGSTLRIRFDNSRNRKHDTSIKITMPSLQKLSFSGATDSRVSGFTDLDNLDIHLSGASVCQLDVNAGHVDALVSGASYLYMNGAGYDIRVDLSGASVLKAFHYAVEKANIKASGASDGNVLVTGNLDALATGASVIIYRGNPAVTSEVSGASTVKQD
jgi:hypothetical protein